MSAQFQVDPDHITSAAADIARISAEIDGQVSAMMGRLTALQGAWTGGAATRFQSLATQWQGTQRQVRESLDAIGGALAAAGTHYAETEAQTLRMFS